MNSKNNLQLNSELLVPIPVRVNRKIRIDTIEAKELAGGRIWEKPKPDELGDFPKLHPTTKEVLGYKRCSAFDYTDVNGIIKPVMKIEQLDSTFNPTGAKTLFGRYDNHTAGRYYGSNSRNFRQTQKTLPEVIDILLEGYSVAPGRYEPTKKDPSHRSRDTIRETQLLLADGDVFGKGVDPTFHVDELLRRYPELGRYATWIGESIKSRSSLNPEMRYRLAFWLEEPFSGSKADKKAWKAMVDFLVEMFPFIDDAVGGDITRLSYGNARPDSLNLYLNGFITKAEIQRFKEEGQRQVEAEAAKTQEAAKRRERITVQGGATQKTGGWKTHNPDHPLRAYTQQSVTELLTDLGCTSSGGNVWHYPGSSDERSFLLNGNVISGFSSTIKQDMPPSHDENTPINGHRFVIYQRYGVDIKGIRGREAVKLYKELADDGFGTFTEKRANPDPQVMHEDFVERILSGELDIPDPIAPPTYAEERARKVEKIRKGESSALSLKRAPDKTSPTEPPTLISLEDSDKANQEAYLKNARLVALQSPTGAGKDQTHLQLVKDQDLYSIETKPHHRVATEKVKRWEEVSVSSWHWRGILHGKEIVEALTMEERLKDPFPEDGSWHCIQPSKVWKYMQQGGNRHEGICLDCPAQEACADIGYNGQGKNARERRAIVNAIPDFFTNPVYKAASEKLYKVQRTRTDDKGREVNTLHVRLPVIDEIDLVKIFNDGELPLSQLQRWRQDWKGKALGEFADSLETILMQKQSKTELAAFINGITEERAETLNRQMSRVRTAYTSYQRDTAEAKTGKVLSRVRIVWPSGTEAYLAVDDAAYDLLLDKDLPALRPREVSQEDRMELGFDSAYHLGVFGKPKEMSADAIETESPRVYKEDWTPLIQLQKLFDRYQPETAPLTMRAGTLNWSLPPILHGHLQRVIVQSATLDVELFKAAFRDYEEDIEVVIVQPTPLAEGSRIFRIRTGNYPRASVLQLDEHFKPTGLKGAGVKLWKMFTDAVEQDPKNTHALITYQCVLEWKADWLKNHPNVIAHANYGGLEGINEMQEADYLWILFSPERTPDDILNSAQLFYGDDAEGGPLSTERTDAGLYTDERMQRVRDHLVKGELIQAVGRARLNRTAGTVIVGTAEDIPTVTNRTECVTVDYEDWLVAESLGCLLEKAMERRADEERFVTAVTLGIQTDTAIAKEFDVDRPTVHNLRVKLGIPHPSKTERSFQRVHQRITKPKDGQKPDSQTKACKAERVEARDYRTWKAERGIS